MTKREQHPLPPLPISGALMVLSKDLKETTMAALSEVPVEQGWQELLERGQQAKVAELRSSDFKTMAQAIELLGIGEAEVRKRIQDGKLFALQIPGGRRAPHPCVGAGPGHRRQGNCNAAVRQRQR